MKLTKCMLLAGAILTMLPGSAIGTPQTEVTNYTYPATVSYFYLFANDGGVSSKLATASGYLKGSDPALCAGAPTDTRACVDLVQSGSSSASAAYPIDITNSTEQQQAFNASGNIKVVGQITYCNGSGTFGGCTQTGYRNIVVTRDGDAGDLAHEFGHAQNIALENYGCHTYVMYPYSGYAHNVLLPDEANLFITPRDTYYHGTPCQIALPDVFHSYYVPQIQIGTTVYEPPTALTNFIRCPNNEVGSGNLQNKARLKVVLRDALDVPIQGVPASEICLLFNGGTGPGLQGFTGAGDDSIIANFRYNPTAQCPDVRCVPADAPSDATGAAYITLIGAGGTRDPFRKWGAYAGDVPVYAVGIKLDGRLTSGGGNGTYTAHVKSFDFVGGRTAALNQGEVVNALDRNAVQGAIGGPYEYIMDFNNTGDINVLDLNAITGHYNHDCNTLVYP